MSGLPREVVRVELATGLLSRRIEIAGQQFDPYRGLPDPASVADIAWAAYCVVVALLLFFAVRRRQV